MDIVIIKTTTNCISIKDQVLKTIGRSSRSPNSELNPT